MNENFNSTDLNSKPFQFNIAEDLLNDLKKTTSKRKAKSNSVEVIFDDEELNDEFQFSVASDGLGFKQEQKTETKLKLNPIKSFKESHKYNQTLNIKKELEENIFDRSDLSPFYLQSGLKDIKSKSHWEGLEHLKEAPKAKNLEELELSQKKIIVTGSQYELFFSWLIDLVVVASFFTATLSLCLLIGGLPNILKLNTVLSSKDLLITLAPLFLSFYLFYFTILDREGNKTFGKKIFSLKLQSKFKSNIDLVQSFSRAFISMISFLAFGLPFILDFQGKLTDTLVVKDND